MDPASLVLAALVWHGSTDIALGRGERGPWQMNESRYDYVDDPTVAIDERGAIAVAWVDQARKDVFFQRFSADGARAGNPVNVSRSPAVFSWLPRIALDSRGRIFILWQEIIFSGGSHGGDILFARSEDGGSTFSKPLNLSNSRAGDGKGRINRDIWHNGSLDLAVGGDGAVYAAWTEYEGALWVRRSSDGGKTFSDLLRINDAKPARAPSLAVSNGTLYLGWTVGDDEAADIRVAKSTDAGASFGAPVIVERSKGYSDAPKLAVDARGTLHLAYAESERGLFGRRHVRYTRSADGAASFERPRDISGRDAGFPALSLDGKGNLYVLWERFADHPLLPRGLALAVSSDGGRTFMAPVLVPDSADAGWNGSSQGLLMRKLAVNRHGAFAIVNSSFMEKQSSRVWLMRGARASER
ncbi:MAG: sialidase family protein [Burkholderiales bacterium]